MLRYQVDFAAQEYEYSDDDFDLDDYWLGIKNSTVFVIVIGAWK